MWNTPKGYVFEIKQEPAVLAGNKRFNYGVKEEFVISFKGNIESVRLVFGINWKGNIVEPYYYNSNEGLVKLSTMFNNAQCTSQDVKTFTRSNRAAYSVGATMICYVRGRLNISTGAWLDDFVCNFYVPSSKCSLERLLGAEYHGKDGILAKMYLPYQGINTFTLPGTPESNSRLRDALVMNVCSKLALGNGLQSREDFLANRMMGYIIDELSLSSK